MTRKHTILKASEIFGESTPQEQMHASSDQGGTDTIDAPSAISAIRQSGLVGMGGAGYPTWKKLAKSYSVVIANAAECEPLLEHNVARLETDSDRVVSGLVLAMKIVGASRGIVAIKSKNTDALDALTASVRTFNDAHPSGPLLSVSLLEDRYPVGDARAVVRDVLGTLIAPTAHTSSVDALLLNVETLLRIHEVLLENRPVATKDITVAGLIDGSGYEHDTSLVLYDVPIGTTIRQVLDALHIATPGPDDQLLLGGPYMGDAARLDDPIAATSGGIMIAGPELRDRGPVGIIVCACGASQDRLTAIVDAEGAQLAGTVTCKNVVTLPDGRLKCANPGICPGQAQAVLALKKQGAASLLISHCTDCTNTVMQIAPKLGMRVHHATDAYLRAGGEHLIRAHRISQTTHQ
ncbi:MAG: proline reductase-associated electron transfer protein PrdC [Acidipropionibacterium sp.]|jgi:proline reductase-associated electron transfer protein PrdC|nr:proline reductase-associated electron transfer protein PrdC [Acidipropionibacterium sp.]